MPPFARVFCRSSNFLQLVHIAFRPVHAGRVSNAHQNFSLHAFLLCFCLIKRLLFSYTPGRIKFFPQRFPHVESSVESVEMFLFFGRFSFFVHIRSAVFNSFKGEVFPLLFVEQILLFFSIITAFGFRICHFAQIVCHSVLFGGILGFLRLHSGEQLRLILSANWLILIFVRYGHMAPGAGAALGCASPLPN